MILSQAYFLTPQLLRDNYAFQREYRTITKTELNCKIEFFATITWSTMDGTPCTVSIIFVNPVSVESGRERIEYLSGTTKDKVYRDRT